MSLLAISPCALENAVVHVGHQIGRIEERARKRRFREKELSIELVSCLLGSQVRFELAAAATAKLIAEGIFEAAARQMGTSVLRKKIQGILGSEILDNDGKRLAGRYRFWKRKSRDVAAVLTSVHGKGETLHATICSKTSERDRRLELIRAFQGIGPKQASLFLRNAGYAENLAILDSQVLKFMRLVGLIMPNEGTVSSLRKYEFAEGRLHAYSRGLGWPLSILDRAIWVVMRVASRGV